MNVSTLGGYSTVIIRTSLPGFSQIFRQSEVTFAC